MGGRLLARFMTGSATVLLSMAFRAQKISGYRSRHGTSPGTGGRRADHRACMSMNASAMSSKRSRGSISTFRRPPTSIGLTRSVPVGCRPSRLGLGIGGLGSPPDATRRQRSRRQVASISVDGATRTSGAEPHCPTATCGFSSVMPSGAGDRDDGLQAVICRVGAVR